MKFLRLEIENIASIANADIDFSADPLKSSTLFLIRGETGVGKTTLLDAIALALYNTAPRFQDMGSRQFVDTANENESSPISMSDPRLIMRRGTLSASSRLTFTGNDGNTYRATWAVHRASRSNRLQSVEHRLENLTRGQSIGGLRNVSAAVTQPGVTGMDFRQFVRTTMLAQGEFTRFLESNDNEKAAILEKITGIDRFTRVGTAINSLTAHARERYNTALSRLEGVYIMTDDERNTRTARLEEIESAMTDNAVAEAEATQRRDWLTRRDALAAAVTQCAATVGELHILTESERHKQLVRLVKEHDAAAPRMRIVDEIDRCLERSAQSMADVRRAAALRQALVKAAEHAA